MKRKASRLPPPLPVDPVVVVVVVPREIWDEIVTHSLSESASHFFALQLVCKLFGSVCKRHAPQLDWLGTLLARDSYFSAAKPTQWLMLRGILYATQRRPVIMERLQQLRVEHKLVYMTRKSGRIYRGEIGTRKMRRIKIEEPLLKKAFLALIREHDRLSKSYNAGVRACKK